MKRTLLACVLGGGIGVPLLMIASTADLFGRVPALEGHVAAKASDVAVVDGQTLRLRDTVLRLAGVSVPQRGVTCTSRTGAVFDCGAEASRKLAALVQGQDVICRYDGRDKASFLQGHCSAGDTDLNRAMIAEP